MASGSDVLSVIALVVSLVALLVTLGQLLQQYLATADGYRRCQASVMGPWAKLTKRRFRWRELRFETTFVVPEIVMKDFVPERLVDAVRPIPAAPTGVAVGMANYHVSGKQDVTILTGSENSVLMSHTPTSSPRDDSTLACWVTLLWDLQHLQRGSYHASCDYASEQSEAQRPLHGAGGKENVSQHGDQSPHDELWFSRLLPQQTLLPQQVPWISDVSRETASLPAIRPRPQSWDFVPPETLRPLAKSNLSDVAVLFHRLGLRWELFDPDQGLLRAQGSGAVVSSTIIRAIGTVLQYSRTAGLVTRLVPYIPTQSADALAFGIIKHSRMGVLHVGSRDDIQRTAEDVFGIRVPIFRPNPDCTPGLGAVLLMNMPVLRRQGSSVCTVAEPTPYLRDYLASAGAIIEFRTNLQRYLSQNKIQEQDIRQTSEIYKRSTDLQHIWESRHPSVCWASPDTTWEKLDNIYDHLKYCDITISGGDRFDTVRQELFLTIQRAHVVTALELHDNAHNSGHGSTMPNSPSRPVNNLSGPLEAFFSNLLAFSKETRREWLSYCARRRLSNKAATYSTTDVEEAWILCIFRAICWAQLHNVVTGPTIPSKYWGSKLPIYID